MASSRRYPSRGPVGKKFGRSLGSPHRVGLTCLLHAMTLISPSPRGQQTILVRRREFDGEIAEGTSLTRQDPAGFPLLLRKDGGGTAPVIDPAGDEPHLARAAASTAAPEHDARPRTEDRGEHGLVGPARDNDAHGAQRDPMH
jgi:hypothetical protein